MNDRFISSTRIVEPQRSDHPTAEVWCSFTNRWVPGFVVDDADERGVVVSRQSDGAVLPRFRVADVRVVSHEATHR